jgi:Lipocalin-like domain
MRKEDLVGAWCELGREAVSGDGRVKPDVPRTSQIMYTPDGFMGVVNTPAGRKTLGQSAGQVNLDGVSDAERAQAALGVVAYAGRYEVDGDIVKHVIYSSLHPDLAGSTQLRRATLAGDDLTLATVADAKGNFFRIRWRRASKM